MKKFLSVIAILSVVFAPSTPAFAVSGDWNSNTSDVWSADLWTSTPAIPGTAAGDVIGLTFNITAARTITLDGAVASRTAGILNIGDTNASHAYLLNASGGGTLTLDNSAAGAQINQVATSAGDTISVPLILNDDLTIANADNNDLTISGTITNTVAATITNSGGGTGGVILSNAISDGTGATDVVQNSGTSALTLSGVNTYSGGTTLTAGTLNINSTTALGATGGAFAINGGVIDNTSGASKTNANNNAITIGGNFAFSTGAGVAANNLNLGTGAVTNAGNRTITLNGTATTLTMGTMTNTSNAVQTTTVNGAGNTLSLGGYALSNNATNRIDVIAGTGNVSITGAVTNGGTATASGLTYTGSGTLVLSGNNTYDGATTMNNGAGKMTLSGDNSGATGGVVLTAGTLNINSATALGTGTVSIANGTTIDNTSGASKTLTTTGAQTWGGDFTFTGTNNLNLGTGTVSVGAATRTVTTTAGTLTVGGAISGTGGLTKDGAAGTLVLNGNNAYTGLTTLTAGTLTLAGNNGSATGGVTLTAGTLNINSATALGTGTFTINGGTIDNSTAGPITLSTNNAQTWGNSFAFTGTSALDLGTGAVTMAANRTVTVNASTLTVGGIISGAGKLTKAGGGTLTLNGANAHTGGTTLNAGTLNLGHANALGAAAGVFTIAGGTIDNTSGSAMTIATNNAQTWSGDFAFTGTNDLNLGTNTATINGGNRTVTVNGGNLTVGGIVAQDVGGRQLIKAGAGTLTLNGINTYTGATSVNGGTLAIGSATTLGGGLNMTTAGTGLTIGLNTLTVAGAYAQNKATATINVGINGTNHGSVDASATGATISAGALNLSVSGYVPNNTNYTIVLGKAAGVGVDATAVTITNPSSVLSFNTVGGAAEQSLIIVATRANTYNTVSGNGNTDAAGAALEAAGPTATGDMLTVLNALDNMGSNQQRATAIETMTPDVSSGTLNASQQASTQFLGSVSNRLGYARDGMTGLATGDMLQGTGFWIQGLGSNLHQDSRGGIQGYSANLFGTTIGADKMVDDHVRVGLAGGYGFAKVNSKTPGSPSDNINSWSGILYGSYDSTNLCKARHSNKNSRLAVRNQLKDNWYVDGMFGFTQNNYDSRREIWVTPTSGRVAKADHYGQTYTSKLEGGYTFVFEATKNLETTPFASLQYSYLRMNKYKESGADALNLSVNGNGFNQLLQTLGTKFAYPLISKKAGTFIPSVKCAWLFDYIADKFETTASFAGGGTSFTTKGARPARNGILIGTELGYLNKGNMTLTANYDLELKDEFIGNTYYATARFDF